MQRVGYRDLQPSAYRDREPSAMGWLYGLDVRCWAVNSLDLGYLMALINEAEQTALIHQYN